MNIDWKKGNILSHTYTRVADGAPETNEWEIVEKGKIIVRQCSSRFARYLEVGKEYKLDCISEESYLTVWEVPIEDTIFPESSAQVLLYDWEEDDGPSFEIDL
jgi:hypothetical protein